MNIEIVNLFIIRLLSFSRLDQPIYSLTSHRLLFLAFTSRIRFNPELVAHLFFLSTHLPSDIANFYRKSTLCISRKHSNFTIPELTAVYGGRKKVTQVAKIWPPFTNFSIRFPVEEVSS